MIADGPKYANHKLIFEFLRTKFLSQEPFTRADCASAAPALSANSIKAYWSKWILPLLKKSKKGEFVVTEALRPYMTWHAFHRNIASQVVRTYSDYKALTYASVSIFDFLMPLANEGHLRTALDALFYKDTISSKLKSIGLSEVEKHFKREPKDTDDTYLDRACKWVSTKFGGYSIHHVNGRFRVASLLTLAEAADAQKDGDRYLIDETTAVVRFIFPCGKPEESKTQLLRGFNADEAGNSSSAVKEYENTRWFLRALFVESILQVVNGEDEIWMLESGMRSSLHRWVIED